MSAKRPSTTINSKRLPKRRFETISEENDSTSRFGVLIYDELLLLIFSYLSYTDLCSIQRINIKWSRLSLDNQLWKNLYLREFDRPRLRGSRGFPSLSMVRADGRPVKALPTKGHVDHLKDWKWMFRISCNWRTGRSQVGEISWSGLSAGDFPAHIALAGGLTIAASPLLSTLPQLILQAGDETATVASPENLTPRRITAIALDQSQPAGRDYRLVVFYSTATFSLFLVRPLVLDESKEIATCTSSDRRARSGTIIQAAYHHPLLVVLSSRFDLSIYELQASETGEHYEIRLRQTLTSFTSHLPTSLVLSMPSPDIYRLLLAYTVPIYPEHWTAGITEMMISSFTVQSSHSTNAFDLGSTWVSLTPELSEVLNEQHDRKLASVSSVSTDGRYVVLASRSTNSIQLFRLFGKSKNQGIKLLFIRNLYGHSRPVQALAVSDGRCVSLSRDGKLWAWDIERDANVEIRTQTYRDTPVSSKVIFDERRILVVSGDRIIINRFDV